ncbi:unnamed protein product [Candidula unifasciata]|uniref:Urease accessory protein D n=1 Tax=Candidula unifasciata TaxID=100452 RepID=A0A8S3YR45_9EUPU|nr:unnamed protein product [Candidula unifasciata]
MTETRHPSKGHGFIEFEAIRNSATTREKKGGKQYYKSEIVSLKHTYPFRYLVPENSTPGACRWIYPLVFGGGLVGGDTVVSEVKLGAGCAAVVSSQDSTKVYHCNNGSLTTQESTYHLGDSSLLCVLQDPLVCYQNADFYQKQVVHMSPSSNLVFLDWMLSGRVALNESWAFKRFRNCIEIQVSNETIIRDYLELEDTPNKTVAQGMHGYQVFGTCIVLGDDVEFLTDSLITKYGRKQDIGDKGSQDLVVSVSSTSYHVQGKTIHGCYLRFLAANMQSAAPAIRSITSPLLPVLGDDPYERKL